MSLFGMFFSRSEESTQDEDVLKKDLSFIEKNPLVEWETDHVSQWLGHLKLPEDVLETFSNQIFKEDIDGMTLRDLSFGEFKKTFNTIEKIHQKKIHSLLRDVMKRGFNKPWTKVFCKYYHLCITKKQPAIGQSFEYADRLADAQAFYDYYFSFFVDFFELRELQDEIKKLSSKKKEAKVKKLKKKAKEVEKRALEKFREMNPNSEIVSENKMKYFAEHCGIRSTAKEKDSSSDSHYRLPCKIIVTEIFEESDSIQKKFRFAVSPILDMIKFKSLKFGIFHTAITVAPWYLEWSSNELVVPKKSFFSAKAIISMDMNVCHYVNVKKIKEIALKLSETCHLWNTKMEYGKKRTENKGNCQCFVDDVIEAVGIDPDQIFNGVFGKLIKRMRRHGKCDLKYEPNAELAKKMKLSRDSYSFDTHKELDEFAKELFYGSSNSVDFPEDYQLLKAFDRAYWLRYIQNPKQKIFCPLEKGDTVLCPFGDPRITASYI